jgi:hypothetical protein
MHGNDGQLCFQKQCSEEKANDALKTCQKIGDLNVDIVSNKKSKL